MLSVQSLITQVREPSHRVFVGTAPIILSQSVLDSTGPFLKTRAEVRHMRAQFNTQLSQIASEAAGPSSTGFQLEELCLESVLFFISAV